MAEMYKFILRRLGTSVVTFIVISMIVFVLSRSIGDPVALLLSEFATGADRAAIKKELHLDASLPEQYYYFAKNALRGDLGKGIADTRPVMTQLGERLPNTLQLGLAAFVFSTAVGLALGVLSAVKRNSLWDQTGKLIAMLGQSVPSFWLGIMLLFLFSVRLGWLPASGKEDAWKSFILPTITLGSFAIAANLRIVRSAMLDVMGTEYIKLARAKGVSPFWVIWKHAVRNALIAPLTYSAVTLGFLLTGSIVAETVFAWPGLGTMAFQAVINADYPVLQGIVLLISAAYLAISLVVDILYAYIDPRIRYA